MKSKNIFLLLISVFLLFACEDPIEQINNNNNGNGGAGGNNNDSDSNNNTLDLENILCLQGITNDIQWFLYATYSPDSEH
ncbi:MAG: hypothetical protein U0K83_06435, partial [Bacteroidales bacterium]|nr:hypothetical protein [Bacteroidales bacterium]